MIFRCDQCLDFQTILEYVSTAPTDWGWEQVLFILNLTEFKCRLAMLSHFFMWHDMTVFLPEHYGRISYTYEPISDLSVVWFEQDWTVVH